MEGQIRMTGLHKEIFKQAETYILMEEIVNMHNAGKSFEEIQTELEISAGMIYELLALRLAITKLKKARKGEM